LSEFRMGRSITRAIADPRRHRPGAEHMKLHGVVRSVRAARRRLDPSGARRVFGPRVAVLGDAPRPLPGARPCAERVGFAVRAWATSAEIVGTREPGPGGYAPAALGLQCLAHHRSSFPSIVGPDSRKPAAMLAIPMA
jgi:hypothetical protein